MLDELEDESTLRDSGGEIFVLIWVLYFVDYTSTEKPPLTTHCL